MRFRDYLLGHKYKTGAWEASEAEIRSFAEKYDCQPLHLDQEFAKNGPFGGITASGWQTLAVAFGLWIKSIDPTHNRGGISLDEARWLKPVYVGDVLRAEVEITSLRKTSKGDKGVVVYHFTVLNQREEVVLDFKTTGFVAV